MVYNPKINSQGLSQSLADVCRTTKELSCPSPTFPAEIGHLASAFLQRWPEDGRGREQGGEGEEATALGPVGQAWAPTLLSVSGQPQASFLTFLNLLFCFVKLKKKKLNLKIVHFWNLTLWFMWDDCMFTNMCFP